MADREEVSTDPKEAKGVENKGLKDKSAEWCVAEGT